MKTLRHIYDNLLRGLRKLTKGVMRASQTSAPPSDDARCYQLADRSFGKPGRNDPLEALTWRELCDEIYGFPGASGVRRETP